MSEPTAQPPNPEEAAASGSQPAAPGAADPSSSQTAEAIESTELSVRDLLEAGVHFGHQTRRWNPRMKPFLFGERNGVHIVDLDQTLPRFRAALEFVRETVASGGKVLFVGTKRQAVAPVQTEATRAGQFYVNNRWLGGMLTNFKTVKKSIERFKEMLALVADEEKVGELTKKELARINRQIDKYRKSLDGMKEMDRLPDAVFVIDVNREEIAVSEAKRLGIPMIAVVDSNSDPVGIDFAIPGNDDSIRAIMLYCGRIASACVEGAALFDERVRAEVAQKEREASEAVDAPAAGRVVVEIKHPPRRRGAASFGGRRDESDLADQPKPAQEPGAPAAPAPTKPAQEPAAPAAPAPTPPESSGEGS
jgi:small subunit ribosomal protein S2